MIPRLDVALAAAREAGRLTLEYFLRAGLAVELKADDSPVTVADREAEQALRARISSEFPDDAILGEEFPERPGSSGYRWILDPIDGTKSFIHGVPLYGTLIGVERAGRSVVGVIQLPALDQCVYAAAGQGAWHVAGGGPPQPARVSETGRWAPRCFAPATTRTGAAAAGSRPWSACKPVPGCRGLGAIRTVTTWWPPGGPS